MSAHRIALDAMSRPVHTYLIGRGVADWDAAHIAEAFTKAFGEDEARRIAALFLDAGWRGNEIVSLINFDDDAWKTTPQTILDAERVLLQNDMNPTCARLVVITKPDYGLGALEKLQIALVFLREIGLTTLDLELVARKCPQSFYQSSERLERIRDAVAAEVSVAKRHDEIMKYLLEQKPLQPIPRPPMDAHDVVNVVPITIVVVDDEQQHNLERPTASPLTTTPTPLASAPVQLPLPLSGVSRSVDRLLLKRRRQECVNISSSDVRRQTHDARSQEATEPTDPPPKKNGRGRRGGADTTNEVIQQHSKALLQKNLETTLCTSLQAVRPQMNDTDWERFKQNNPALFADPEAVSASCNELQRWNNLPTEGEQSFLGKILADTDLRRILLTPASVLSIRMYVLRANLELDFVQTPMLLLLPFETVADHELRFRVNEMRDRKKDPQNPECLAMLFEPSRKQFVETLNDQTVATE